MYQVQNPINKKKLEYYETNPQQKIINLKNFGKT